MGDVLASVLGAGYRDFHMTFSSGRSLTEVIDQRGLKRKWIASQMQVARQTFSVWEHGHEPMPEGRVEQLAELLELSVGEVRELLPGPTQGVVVA